MILTASLQMQITVCPALENVPVFVAEDNHFISLCQHFF